MICYGCGRPGANHVTEHERNGRRYWHALCHQHHIEWLQMTGPGRQAQQPEEPEKPSERKETSNL